MKTGIIIPIRGRETSMSRLRPHLPHHLVNSIVSKLLHHTIEELKTTDWPIYILTSDTELNLEQHDNIERVIDEGKGLNLALSQFAEQSELERLVLIMPDLPGWSYETFEKVYQLQKVHSYLIANTEDMGTAVAILPNSMFTHNLFGENSAAKLIEKAKTDELPVAQIEIQELARDLDTPEDYKYWQEDLEMKFAINDNE